MASFSFGSFGDLVTLAELAYRIYDAGSTTGSLAKDLSASRKYLENLLAICQSVKRTVDAGATPHTDDTIAFRKIINNCSDCLKKFASFLDQFEDDRQIVRVSRRLRYCLLRKSVINQFEARLQGFVVMLSILQTKVSEQGVKAQIVRSLDEPWDQRPIKFQDALGRRYPLPLEVCGTFNDFLSFVQAAFRTIEGLRNAIAQRQFWLFTPAGSVSASAVWYIISERHWKLACRPGAMIDMSLASSEDDDIVPRSSTWKVATCDCDDTTGAQARENDFLVEEASTLVEGARAQVKEPDASIGGDQAGLGKKDVPAQCSSATQAVQDHGASSSSVDSSQPRYTYCLSCRRFENFEPGQKSGSRQDAITTSGGVQYVDCMTCARAEMNESRKMERQLRKRERREGKLATTARDLDDETVKAVRFSQPMPHWATYDAETEFRLL